MTNTIWISLGIRFCINILRSNMKKWVKNHHNFLKYFFAVKLTCRLICTCIMPDQLYGYKLTYLFMLYQWLICCTWQKKGGKKIANLCFVSYLKGQWNNSEISEVIRNYSCPIFHNTYIRFVFTEIKIFLFQDSKSSALSKIVRWIFQKND